MESLVICLHIYSGAPNPQWEIASSSPDFRTVTSLLQNHINAEHPSILGYRGYTVVWMRDGQTLQEYKIVKKSLVELEKLLIDTAPDEVKQKLRETVYQALAAQ